MFERFTQRARQVVALAQQEARELGHETLEPEHILLGLLGEAEGLAAQILAELELRLEETRESLGPVHNPPTSGDLPLSHATKTALELALREALSLGHNYIGTEHILLGLVRGPNRALSLLAIKLKTSADQAAERIRREVIMNLNGPSKLTSKPQVLEEGRTLVARLLEALEAKPSHRKGSYASVLEQLSVTATTGAKYLRGR